MARNGPLAWRVTGIAGCFGEVSASNNGVVSCLDLTRSSINCSHHPPLAFVAGERWAMRLGVIGEGSVMLATNQALSVWQPKAVIMIGIAFGKDPEKQKIGDVLVASQIIPYEQIRVGEEVVFRGPIPPSNTTLLNHPAKAPDWSLVRPDGKDCTLLIGPNLSEKKLVDSPMFKQQLFKQFPQAIGGEMEGAGLYAASGRIGIAWILIKSICDWGMEKRTKNINH